MKTVLVLTVLIDVNIVIPKLTTVLFVPLTDLTLQNVTVLMDSMITVMMLNVNHVPLNA
jgi:uncharacterized protein (DUF2062 family)